MQEKFVSVSGEARQVMWDRAIDGIKERPVLGYGVENFGYVFDRNLDTRVSIPEHPLWFDRAHNFVIDHLAESGIIGFLALLAVFGAVVWTSLKLYLRNRKFYFLAIPFILFLHFLQLQTFFQINSSLLLMFILMAFLVSHEKDIKFKIPKTYNKIYGVAVFALGAVLLYFFIYIPAIQNLVVNKIYAPSTPEERVEALGKLDNLRLYPAGTIDLLTNSYIASFSTKEPILENQEYINKAMELRALLALYENYFDKYEDNFRFLLEYARLINFAYGFGIDELDKGREVINMALEISEEYPHPHLLLAQNLYHSGDLDQAAYLAEFGGSLAINTGPTQENIGFVGIKSGIKPVVCFGS